MSHYKNLNDELNWDNVNFPSSDVDIDTFEENNGGKIAVNVYFIDPEEGKQSILLYRQSKVSKSNSSSQSSKNWRMGMTTTMYSSKIMIK